MKSRDALVVSAAVLVCLSGCARATYIADLVEAAPPPQEAVYKTVDGVKLTLYVFAPRGHKATHRRAAVVCIHGGGWMGGTPELFFPHARYFASRGAVAFSVNYRLSKVGGPTVFDCLADCKSAVRYIRANASVFGVDPDRIAAVGDSAGGHLAACLGTIERFDEPGEDRSINSTANAMLLYNPVLDLLPLDWAMQRPGIAAPDKSKLSVGEAAGILSYGKTPIDRARAISPLHNVVPDQPPAFLMHGTEDKSVPVEQARRFAKAMKEAGNRCDYIELEGIAHAFVLVNYTAPEEVVVDAIRAGDRFLTSLGYLEGEATVARSKRK